MELIEAFLSVLLAGLSALLAVVAFLAYRYFPDQRFILVGIGLLGLGSVGVLSMVSVFYPPAGTAFDVGEVPLAVLVGVVLLLNGSLMRRKATEDRSSGG